MGKANFAVLLVTIISLVFGCSDKEANLVGTVEEDIAEPPVYAAKRTGGDITLSLASENPGELVATWTSPVADNHRDYRVRWAKDSESYASWKDDSGNIYPASDDKSHTWTGLEEGVIYKVQARARLGYKNDAWSGPWVEAKQRIAASAPDNSEDETLQQASQKPGNGNPNSGPSLRDFVILNPPQIIQTFDEETVDEDDLETAESNHELTDAQVRLTLNGWPAWIQEPDPDGPGGSYSLTLTYTFRVASSITQAVSVTVDNVSPISGTDYNATYESVATEGSDFTFASSSSFQVFNNTYPNTVTINVLDDGAGEQDEVVKIQFTATVDGLTRSWNHILKIRDGDIGVSLPDNTVTEGTPSDIILRVNLQHERSYDASFLVRSSGIDGSESYFTGINNVVTVPSGSQSYDFSINVVTRDNSAVGDNRRFHLSVLARQREASQAYTVLSDRNVVRINNDDFPAIETSTDTVSIVRGQDYSDDTLLGSGRASFRMRIAAPPTQPVTVTFSSSVNQYEATTGPLTFTRSNWSRWQTVNIAPSDLKRDYYIDDNIIVSVMGDSFFENHNTSGQDGTGIYRVYVIEDIPDFPAVATGLGRHINEAMDNLAEDIGYVYFSSLNLADSGVLYLHGIQIIHKEMATSLILGHGSLPWVSKINNYLHGSCLKIRREGDDTIYEAPYYVSVFDGTQSNQQESTANVIRSSASTVRHGWLIGGNANADDLHEMNRWIQKTATGKKPLLDYVSGDHDVNLWIYPEGHAQNTCTP